MNSIAAHASSPSTRHGHQVDSLHLKTNVIAAYVAGGLAKQLPDLMSSLKVTPKSSYEVAFNRACGMVEGGDLAGAEMALRLAIKQGEMRVGIGGVEGATS